MRRSRLLNPALLACALAAATRAQTFIVDSSSSPGTQFTEIAAAIASVPDNATLLVRSGSYAPFVLDAKGLTLLADANVVVTGSCAVRNTQPGQPVSLAGLELMITPGEATVLLLENCADRVLLHNLRTPAILPPVPVVSVFYSLPLGLFATG
ncbi:MAG: hypothetical protein AB8H80_22695 [Planctomycetota bacterium]